MHIVGLVHAPAPSQHYRLEQFEVLVGTHARPEARVTLAIGKGGEKRSEKATGDGPVDAIYRAIEHVIGTPFELKSYTIRSVTEGQDALGEVNVRVEYAGKTFPGRAASTDILRASAEAYIDALNHIELHKASDQYVIGAIMDSYQNGPNVPW
jgi:2-isopropylmalate synthase